MDLEQTCGEQPVTCCRIKWISISDILARIFVEIIFICIRNASGLHVSTGLDEEHYPEGFDIGCGRSSF